MSILWTRLPALMECKLVSAVAENLTSLPWRQTGSGSVKLGWWDKCLVLTNETGAADLLNTYNMASVQWGVYSNRFWKLFVFI